MIPDEQETTITYDNGQKIVRIFSARQADWTKLKKAGVNPLKGTQARGFFYEIPLARLFWKVRKLKDPAKKGVFNGRRGKPIGKVGLEGIGVSEAAGSGGI